MFARERGLRVTVLFPGLDSGDAPRFFRHRDRAVVEQADEVHAFWDGQSAGTRHAVILARYLGKPVHVEIVRDGVWQQVA